VFAWCRELRPTMTRPFFRLAAVWITLSAGTCPAEIAEVRVRVIDAQKKRPKPGVVVDLVAFTCSELRDCRAASTNYFSYCHYKAVCRDPRTRIVSSFTDQSGTISLSVETKTERMLRVVLGLDPSKGEAKSERDWLCSPHPRENPPDIFDILEVLRSGVVARQCWHKSRKLDALTPQKGEIIVFWDKLGDWERMFYPTFG